MSELDTPTDLRYTAEHEWVKRTGPTTVRVGITDFAQSQLGDVVFVQLPAVDEDVTAGESLGEVESTKSVSDIFAPFTAKVLAANGELDGQPDLVNTDPYDKGWLVELEVADEATLDAALAATLDAEAYNGLTSE
ncbi:MULTISPECIES: glycine cleavage system protein GcvH [Rhodococcus]|uniref:glycine cleavage system protein GcvH n=1 Tax=Rhodococcus TaxID=1827 RepID=UPI001E32A81D|nr:MULTISPECIES: glycine cleavage system protein GcvH [Rhodococcus]MCD2106963.1 glycine cleavage system protein GcvH [Rhodococcus qingshengii]MCZ4525870.1 glycine cleavage system protein GcvH [Rhodococcus erythropolis]MDV8008934.1 glycine cleavage system protein GcvH [Rhodococcus sp. IEGM 1318]MDZ7913537.1 glycine cleavage system protein GcvH [Rhodococcus sp. (in: high G+C Gram-positive bacteria)]